MTRLFLLLSIFTLFLTACSDDDDPIIPNEEEVITDLVYVLTPDDNSGIVTMTFSDPDGDGADPATITVSDSLRTGVTYAGVLSLTNSSDPTDPDDITTEIREENVEHQFFFIAGGGLNAQVTYADEDDNGDPLGLLTELSAQGASEGTLRIVLRHEPDKAAGATIGDPSSAGGETDIEVTFPVVITN